MIDNESEEDDCDDDDLTTISSNKIALIQNELDSKCK